MIRIFVAHEGNVVHTVDVAGLRRLTEENPVLRYWIDLSEPTDDEETEILEHLMQFHPLAIDDCRRERLSPTRGDHLPKVEDYGNYVFSIINPIEISPKDPREEIQTPEIATFQLNAFLGEHYVVTHHYEPLVEIESVIVACTKNILHLERGPDYIYHLVLDAIVDRYTPILDRFDEQIEDLEDDIFGRADRSTLARLLSMKRQVFKLRRITTYQREMVYRLSRGEFPLITQEEIAYYRNVFDHLVRAAELTESYRDILTGLLDAYLSMTSNRLNEVMKVLTIISTFFLPLTFVAGVYGMNFDPDTSPFNMPELRWIYGYPFAWGVMLVMAVGMFVYFKRRKWL